MFEDVLVLGRRRRGGRRVEGGDEDLQEDQDISGWSRWI